MFDLILEDVPGVHAWSKKGYWFDHFYEWSVKVLKHVPIAVTDDTLEDLYHIAVYENSKGVPHSVIAKCDDIIWDPSPNEKATEIEDTAYRIVFVQLGSLSVQQACRISHEMWERENEQGTMGRSGE
jgi:hypothetical protein